MFTKGPLGFILPFAVTVVYLIASGNGRKFFRYWGWRTWSVLIILTALWFLGMYLEGGASYLHDFIVNQTVNRTFESLRHGRPFYYYCLTIWYILAPWTLLVLGIVMVALHPKFVKSAIQTFFLTAGVTIFVVLSCVDQKMQIYMLPGGAIPYLWSGNVPDTLPRQPLDTSVAGHSIGNDYAVVAHTGMGCSYIPES